MTSEELKAWMDERGYSVRGLASELGRHSRTVQRWRDGSAPIPHVVEVALEAIAARED